MQAFSRGNIQRIAFYLSWVIILFLLCCVGINIYIVQYSKQYITTLPPVQVERGIILWASVKHDGELSPLLQQRVDQGNAAYQDGLLQRLLVSWFDAGPEYQEATSMAWYLLEHNFPDTKLLIDGQGLDTYDSLRRAKHIYGIEQGIIFTQSFHLARSLYIARKLWMDARWYPVDLERPTPLGLNFVREFFARIKAFVEIEFRNRT